MLTLAPNASHNISVTPSLLEAVCTYWSGY
jgi:hypothetical protein